MNVPSANRERLVAEKKHAESSNDKPAFWLAFFKKLGRSLVLPLIGCGVTVAVYTIAARKTTAPPQVIVSTTPKPEAPIAVPAPQTPAATPISEPSPATTPTPQAVTPLAQTSQSPSQREPVIHSKTARKKHTTHD
jgi:hypothetical protein